RRLPHVRGGARSRRLVRRPLRRRRPMGRAGAEPPAPERRDRGAAGRRRRALSFPAGAPAVKIARPLLLDIEQHGREGYPFEICGVLLGRGERRVERVVRAVNRETERPRVRYTIAPEDLLQIQRESREAGLEILGYYHSHPDHPARPSETDRLIAAGGLSDGVLHIVVCVEKAEGARPTAAVVRDATQ